MCQVKFLHWTLFVVFIYAENVMLSVAIGKISPLHWTFLYLSTIRPETMFLAINVGISWFQV
jgi:hypothetical protein